MLTLDHLALAALVFAGSAHAGRPSSISRGGQAKVNARQESCPDGQTLCTLFDAGGEYTVCTDLQTNVSTCGSCGRSCLGGADASCVDGMCMCRGEPACLGYMCPDFQTDPFHCGGCDNYCGENSECEGGVCQECGPGTTFCDIYGDDRGPYCYPILSDPEHCGGCDNVCPEGVDCVDGACQCQAPLKWCSWSPPPNEFDYMGAWCPNITENRSNCGDCHVQCAANELCVNSECSPCPEGQTVCNEQVGDWYGPVCINQMDNNMHCGGCGEEYQCRTGTNCVNGECVDTAQPTTTSKVKSTKTKTKTKTTKSKTTKAPKPTKDPGC